MRIPTTDELGLINIQRSEMGLEPYEQDQVQIITFRALHNLVTRSGYAWDIRTGLLSLANTYENKPLTADHAHWNVEKNMGRILQAKVVKKDESEIPIEVLNNQAEKIQQINADIYDKLGYYELLMQAWVDSGSDLIPKIKSGAYSEVSFSGGAEGGILCPLSTLPTSYDPESDNYFQRVCNSDDCKRCVIDLWGYAQKGLMSDEELTKYPVFSYYLKGLIHESYELSFVGVGNVPGAKIIDDDEY